MADRSSDPIRIANVSGFYGDRFGALREMLDSCRDGGIRAALVLMPDALRGLYTPDAQGRIRHHQFGEGEYERTEAVIRQLLRDAG